MSRAGRIPHIVLAALMAVAVPYAAYQAYERVASLLDAGRQVRQPFGLEAGSAAIAWEEAEARAAGILEGDLLERVDGRPFTGAADLRAPLGRARAGGRLMVTVSRKNATGGSERLEAAIALEPLRQAPAGAEEWLLGLVMSVAMPLLCLLLGFWVAAVRPRDHLAWLVLALMLSFGQVVAGDVMHWPRWARDVALAYGSFFGSAWGACMMLFGIYFPDRLFLDRRWPWAKWLLLGPLALSIAAAVIASVGEAEHLAAVDPLARLLRDREALLRLLNMAAISIFFMSIGTKSGMESSPDAKRRLVLLYAGASASMIPSLIVAIATLVSGRGFREALPAWYTAPAFAMLFLFPVTMAYVIVVHRALDVRVVIRQGLQYAFARGGVAALRAILALAIVAAMIALLARPNAGRLEMAGVIGTGLVLFAIAGRAGRWLLGWTDRRFFRDAYSAEQILSDLGEQVRTMVETGPLLQTVAARISDSLHVRRLAALVGGPSGYEPAHAVGCGELGDLRFPAAGGVPRRLQQTGQPTRVDLADPGSWVNREPTVDEAERAALARLGSDLLLPLCVKERLSGFVSLGPKQSEEPYSANDLRLLRSVATQTALALENSRLTAAIASEVAQREVLNREVEIAREVQERLFPQHPPAVPGLDYAGACRPALGVGGDYYDFLALREGALGIAIGDVSGKGIGAALLMASLQASLRGQTLQETERLEAMMRNVNRLVYEASPENRYATFFYAQYDPATRLLTYVNAGHCPPIVLRRDRAAAGILRLKEGGTVIGLFRDSAYRQGEVTLEPGDLLIAYTDGISEAMNGDEEEWGEEKLIEAARACDGLSAADAIARLLRDADAFVSGAPQHDDMTLVVARVA